VLIGGPPVVRPPARPQRAPAATAPRPARPPRPDRPAADPRILARRVEVLRSEGRRRLRRLLWGLGALALVGAAAASTQTALLDVDHVRVDGAARVPIAEVLDAAAGAGAATGAALVDVDEGDVARAVESLPGVADATVRRDWPGTVELTVVERVPVAAVTGAGGAAVVAADGVVVDTVAAAPAGLPVLATAAERLERGAVVDAPDLLAVAAALPPELAGRVAAVAPGGAGAGEVELRLVDGGVARLGPPADLGPKLVAVATVLDQVDLACLATLDVRVPSAPAVTRSAACAA
jgi:cell division protein FtsQ